MVTVVRLSTVQCDSNSIQFQIHLTYAKHWKCLPTMVGLNYVECILIFHAFSAKVITGLDK
jgi:hypothetical protein